MPCPFDRQGVADVAVIFTESGSGMAVLQVLALDVRWFRDVLASPEFC